MIQFRLILPMRSLTWTSETHRLISLFKFELFQDKLKIEKKEAWSFENVKKINSIQLLIDAFNGLKF